MRTSILTYSGNVLPMRRASRQGFSTRCPLCGVIHFKPFRTGTQRGLLADLCIWCFVEAQR